MTRISAAHKSISLYLAALTVVEGASGPVSGRITYVGLPVPGVTVTASKSDAKQTAVTDVQGNYSFKDLDEGSWKVEAEMSGFTKLSEDVAVTGSAIKDFELTMLPIADMHARPVKLRVPGAAPALASRMELKVPRGTASKPDQPKEAASAEAPPDPDSDLTKRSADSLLINGSVNNGASSPFSQMQAFGNNRKGGRSLYNGNIGFTMDHSIFDAAPYSLTGQATPKPEFYHMQGLASFGGPLRIPKLVRNGPQVFINYQWARHRNANISSVLMPTVAERGGDFSQSVMPLGQPLKLRDPTTGLPFAGNIVPVNRISPQALAVLSLFPLPNFSGSTRYNFQTPIVSDMHQDSLQTRASKQIGRNDNLGGMFALQSTRSGNANGAGFGFEDTSEVMGINSNLTWRHTFAPRFFGSFGLQFSRATSRLDPFFANRANIEGAAGIGGTYQQSQYWGPPGLNFTGGIASLNDGQYSRSANRTTGVSYSSFWSRGKHNLSFGTDFRRLQFNLISQQDPRGTFTFTGASTGSDFAGFLLGVPDTSSIAYGNADKYFRSSAFDLFISDDFRLRPGLALNVGGRWDYTSPISEQYKRLVNLNITPRFTTATPLVGERLINPDRRNFSPRLALAWRPLASSSMVIRGGFGVYYDTSAYQPIASLMAQQAPLSRSVRIANTAAQPLTLANGFPAIGGTDATTFGVDPNFRIGYAQNWQLAIQRDLPFALQVVATYLGIKGTRAIQQFLPNTYPTGAVNPCSTCPSGFSYLKSNGNSTRESGMIQLRRKLRSGFASELAYTYSKSIDDAALAGKGMYLTAQDWLDLSAERARSNFDQRHLLTLQLQYTSGMGIHGGGLVDGWRGAALKEWTFTSQINLGSGLPLTPTYPYAVAGTGVTGSIRPDYTGVSIYNAPNGLNLNPAAYTIAVGHWGNAGRNTVTGPSQFTLNGSMSRTFRLTDRFSGDLRIDATNLLNHPTFPSWNTVITSSQFGLPTTANSMRAALITFRVRF